MQPEDRFKTEEASHQIEKLNELGWYHSIELPGGQIIKGCQPIDHLKFRLAQFPVPNDLTGKRVLDIGAWDGWFSFECERRGAEVVAVDSTEIPRFRTAKELLGSKVEYRVQDVCRLSPQEIGYFDIVLFLGVLYHLKHPLLALEKVCELATDMACVESFVIDDGTRLDARPVMEFYETTELLGQFDNWVGPNTSCLLALCRTAGFARVRLESVVDCRAHVTCYRGWPDVGARGPVPYIHCVENAVSLDQMFSNAADDYVGIWFESPEAGLDRNNVFIDVGRYGSGAVNVQPAGDGFWHAVSKLPLGLPSGWHQVRLRARDSHPSNAVRIGIDSPANAPQTAGESGTSVRITLVTDGKTWEHGQIRLGTNSSVSLWVSGLPDDSDRAEVKVRLNRAELPAIFLSAREPGGLRQVNARLPSRLRPGDSVISVVFRDKESAPVPVRLVPG